MSQDSIFSAQLSHLRRSRAVASRAASDASTEAASQAATAAQSPRGHYQPSSRSVPSTPIGARAHSDIPQRPPLLASQSTLIDKSSAFDSAELFKDGSDAIKGHHRPFTVDNKVSEPKAVNGEKCGHSPKACKTVHHSHHNSEPHVKHSLCQTPSPPLSSLPSSLFQSLPPLCRSYSTTTEAHTHSQSPSPAGFSQKIPLRTLSLSPTAVSMLNLSPLSIPSTTPSPTFISPTDTHTTIRASPQLSQSQPSSQSFDGLTPASTLRTLKPLLTQPSSRRSSNELTGGDDSNLPSMTPSSAMRMLLTGQSGSMHTQAPIQSSARRLCPNLQPLLARSDTAAPPPYSPSRSLPLPGSPSLAVINASSLESPLIPSLIRSCTTDQSSPSLRQRTPVKSASQRNIFNVPDLNLASTNSLSTDLEDADDEEEDELGVRDSKPPSLERIDSIVHPSQHSPILQKLLSLLPFRTGPRLLHTVESVYATLITLSLFVALFSDSVRLAVLPKAYDRLIALLLGWIALLLSSECFAFFLTNKNYRWTFESMLDLCSVLSLLPQIVTVYYEIPMTRLQFALMMMMRAGVMVRLVGLLRLFPVKSFKQLTCLRAARRLKQRLAAWLPESVSISDSGGGGDGSEADNDNDDSTSPASHASRIGQMLSDYTAHRVVLSVFVILLVYNYFHPNCVRTVHPFAIHHLNSLMDGSVVSDPSLTQSLIQNYQSSDSGKDLISLMMDGVELLPNTSARIHSLRLNEIEYINTSHYNASIDIKHFSQRFALFDCWCLLMMLVMCPLLLCLIFEDVHAVIDPIERMVKFVANLAKDPLSEIAPLCEKQQHQHWRKKRKRHSLLPQPDYIPYLPINDHTHTDRIVNSDGDSEAEDAQSLSRPSHSSAFTQSQFPLDSLFVELTLQKLAILLQLVFGSAGAHIIANNIKGDYLEVQVPGRKIYGIFAFITLDSYSEIIACLEQQASTLTNDLSELIHSLCVLFGGEINKNIGNSWLLVWKLEAADREEKEKVKLARRASLLQLGQDENASQNNSATVSDWNGTIEMQMPTIPVLKSSTSFPSQLPPAEPLSPTHTGTSDSPSALSVASLSPTNDSSLPERTYSSTSPSMVKGQNRLSTLRRRTVTASDLSFATTHTSNESGEVSQTPPSKSRRRDSLLDSMKKLGQKARGSILGGGPFALLGHSDDGKENAKNDREVVEDDKTLPSAAVAAESHRNDSGNNGNEKSPDPSYYNRTLPTPPLHRHQHGWKQNAENSRIAEQALSSFLLTIVQLATSPSLGRWRHHPLLQSHNLSLNYGIGLHVGWAIEGAIGSAHKIDASYLSPNVNLCSRLSMLCHYYHVPLLFSSTLFSLLGAEVQKRCRKIDVVSVKGSRRPIGIYTFDIDFGAFDEAETVRDDPFADTASVPNNVHQTYDERMRSKQVNEINEIMMVLKKLEKSHTQQIAKEHLDKEEQQHRDDDIHDDTGADINADFSPSVPGTRYRRASTGSLRPPNAAVKRSSSSDMLTFNSPLLPSLLELLALLQSNVPQSFVPLFNAASSCYIDGDWRSAGRLLVRVLTLKPTDGPSQLLLRVMAQHGFRAPIGWKGFRQLSKK